MRQRALFNQVLNEPNRKFFGFNRRTEKIINKSFEKFVNKELRNLKYECKRKHSFKFIICYISYI